MKWDDLALLLEVSRSATMTEAARKLSVDQTTISRRLQALERSVGLPLVIRRRDGVVLTEAGEKAARSAELMETKCLDLERELVGADGRLAGRLRVTTVDMITHYHPELFTDFAEAYPGVDLEVETDSSPRSLSRRDADVAIRWLASPQEGLLSYRLARAEFALYAARSLKRRVGSRAPLSRYPWLGFTTTTDAPHIHQFMLTHVPDATVVCRYEDLPSLIAALRAGGGVCFMPCAVGDADPDLVRLRPVEPGFAYDVWCLAHPEVGATARVRSFIDHARVYFEARQDLYAGRRPC